MSEFDLIRRLVSRAPNSRPDVIIGPGDDGAVLAVPAGMELVLTTDTLVAGRHFPTDTPPTDIGWKALAVNLSDVAAMGARPAWITVALTLPDADEAWLAAFMHGLAGLLEASGATLVGGDLTRGPLTITIQAAGLVPAGRALRRDSARPGDAVCVTGTLGDAALGLALWLDAPAGIDPTDRDFLLARLTRPQPRCAAGETLRAAAHAAVDISDGLAADLGHMLTASGVGAHINVDSLPLSPAFRRVCANADRLDHALAGGDDYELCVALPPEQVSKMAATLKCGLTEIGRIEDRPGLRLMDAQGRNVQHPSAGYDHFD